MMATCAMTAVPGPTNQKTRKPIALTAFLVHTSHLQVGPHARNVRKENFNCNLQDSHAMNVCSAHFRQNLLQSSVTIVQEVGCSRSHSPSPAKSVVSGIIKLDRSAISA